ncbi:MAG: hypothetical protein II923_01180 [Campylobacter sp.]|nr:hypothetical protein [Campylobacter sp.]MBQ7271382.1 hypothetical protein [Campylobacter sp.]MBR0071775.1 hypothetical protein [Campylobacter sp.]
MKYILLVFCMLFLNSCSINNKFLDWGKYGFVSRCNYFSNKPISDEKIYISKNENYLDIYVYTDYKFTDNFYTKIDVFSHHNGKLPIVPIENCNDEWCKIYYPCGDTEYFVKKDDIEQYKTWGHKK